MKYATGSFLAIAVLFLAIPAFALPDVSKLLSKEDVEKALKTKVDVEVKKVRSRYGGTQVIYSSQGTPAKKFLLTLRTDKHIHPDMIAKGFSAASMYKSDKTLYSQSKPLKIKDGEGFSASDHAEILKQGMQLTGVVQPIEDKAAVAVRDSLLLKAANRLAAE